MARSQIIKDLIRSDKSVSTSLQELLVIVNELDNKELNIWIKNELNGYGKQEDIPDYRKNLPNRIVYTGINGNFKVSNQPLPIHAFGEHAKEISSSDFVKNSILELENSKDTIIQMDLTMFAGDVYRNTGIACFSISMQFGKNISDMIISNVKTKIIESLLLLEKEFGLLDELYIGKEKLNGEKINEVNENINLIIFSDGARY